MSSINKDKYLPTVGNGYKTGVITAPTTDSLTITEGDNIVKVCYYRRNDMSYIVKYLENGTNKELNSSVERINKKYLDTYEENALTISGYNVDSNKKSITIAENNNEIIFYYTKKNNLSYTVKYLEKDTEKELYESKTTGNQTFDSTVTEEAVTITGYNVDSNEKDKEDI